MSSGLPSRPGRRPTDPPPTQQEDSPFTSDDLVEMNRQLSALDKADRLIARSVRAGIDMSALQAQSREVREQLTRLKTAFFPGE